MVIDEKVIGGTKFIGSFIFMSFVNGVISSEIMSGEEIRIINRRRCFFDKNFSFDAREAI